MTSPTSSSNSLSRGSGGLQHTVAWSDKSARIVLEGEIDMRVAPTLRAILHDVINQTPDGIVVDLAGVPFIDSSGVATFVEALRILMRSKKSLRLENATEPVLYTLKITQLQKVFGIE